MVDPSAPPSWTSLPTATSRLCGRPTPPLKATHLAHEPIIINGRDEGPLRKSWYNYVIPLNGSGHPAMSVPCGRTASGLPLGLQVAGPWRSEPLLLRVAAALEALRPWAQDWPAAAG